MSNLYNSGIQGYTLKGDIGERGQHSYNIFYSIYDCNNKEGLDTVERLINEGKSLSKDNVDGIIYNEHDTILDVKAHMYECKLDPSENKLKISYIGNIINQTSSDDTIIDLKEINFNISLSPGTIETKSTNSPYKYHKDPNFVTNVEIGGLTDLSSDIHKKLVILHRCGLVQEFDIDDENSVQINDRYAYMVANTDGKKYVTNGEPSTNIDYTKYFNEDCKIYVDIYNKNSTYRFLQNKGE